MRIEAAGKTWIVEARELAPGMGVGQDRFYGVTFRNQSKLDDVVQVRWVLKPARMTPHVARELFDLAGLRLWRDPRDGQVHRVHLETEGPAPAAAADEGWEANHSICFQSRRGTVGARWTLGKSLGSASDGELIDLLDRARPV